jgi:YggT family protein
VTIARIAIDVLWLYQIIIIARLLLSWFPNPPDGLRPVYRFLFAVTEPVLRLVRPLIPPIGGLDLSPLLIFAVIYILQLILAKYA